MVSQFPLLSSCCSALAWRGDLCLIALDRRPLQIQMLNFEQWQIGVGDAGGCRARKQAEAEDIAGIGLERLINRFPSVDVVSNLRP